MTSDAPIGLGSKLSYAVGDLGPAAATTAKNLYWVFFAVSVGGLPVTMAGAILLASRMWESACGLAVGVWSDRIATRWGRRRPFLIAGSVPMGVGFVLLFSEPPTAVTSATAYYLAALLLFDTAFVVVNTPYSALLPDLTADYDERSSLSAWRMANSLGATLLTAALFQVLADRLGGGRNGFALAAFVFAVPIVASPLVTGAFVRERAHDPPAAWRGIRSLLRDLWANEPFRAAGGAYLASAAAIDVVTTIFVWYLVFVVGAPGPVASSAILAVVLASAAMSLPFVVRMMRSLGKKRAFQVMLVTWAATQIVLSLLPAGEVGVFVALAALAGVGYGAASVIPFALLADVVDVGHAATGKRRSGAYAGVVVSLRKLVGAAAVFAATTALGLFGFVEASVADSAPQPSTAIVALRVLFGAGPAVLLVLALWSLRRYDLSRDDVAALGDQLRGHPVSSN